MHERGELHRSPGERPTRDVAIREQLLRQPLLALPAPGNAAASRENVQEDLRRATEEALHTADVYATVDEACRNIDLEDGTGVSLCAST